MHGQQNIKCILDVGHWHFGTSCRTRNIGNVTTNLPRIAYQRSKDLIYTGGSLKSRKANIVWFQILSPPKTHSVIPHPSRDPVLFKRWKL